MSAFYDLASLVLVPSGYKASKVYAQKPLTTDGQLTFSRASTATRVNSAGLIETVSSNVPRLDYTNSSCPKLLLEKQSTNYFTNSAPMVTTGWTSTGVTLTAGQADPAGGTGALRVQMAAGSSSMYRIFGYAAVSYARSAYMKANTAQSVRFEDPFTGNGVVANLTTQWQRFSFAEVVAIGMGMQFTNANDNAAKDFFLAFPQIEESTYATSFIPTTSSAVTRLADTASKTGVSSLVGGTEGTMFVEGFQNSPVTCVPFQLSDGTNNNRVQIEISSVGAPLCVASSGGATQAVIVGSSKLVGTNRKIAITFKANEFKLYENGQLIGTDTSGAIPVSLSAIYLGSESGSVYTGFTYKQILDFKTVLTEAQCKELTAL